MLERLKRLLLPALVILPFVLCQLSAQESSSASKPSLQKDSPKAQVPYRNLASIHVRSSLVVATVTVTDSSGHYIEDLHKTDFKVLDNNVPQRITEFKLVTEPVAAVIVIQTNKDVAPVLGEVHPLGVLFSDLLLGRAGEAAVVTYADKTQVVQNFSSDPGTLAKTLRQISVEGSEARLNDALARAILMLANRTNAKRRIIIVFSGGFDRGSETSGAEIIRAASEANVEIYGLRFSPAGTAFKSEETSGGLHQVVLPGPQAPVPSPPFRLNLAPLAMLALKMGSSELRTNLLAQYAGYTGGVVYTHWKGRTLQSQLQNIALEINSQYLVAYVPSNLDKMGFHHIQIEVAKPELRVRTRAGYFYDSSQ